MNASKQSDLKRLSAYADETISLHSDLKQSAVDECLRHLCNFIKHLLRTKKCKVDIFIVSATMK